MQYSFARPAVTAMQPTSMTRLRRLLTLLSLPAVDLASSNISGRSYLNNYSDGLNVVKREPEKEEEYVTDFYKRVRDKRRAMLSKMASPETSGERRDDHYFDHSLDHYFDHHLGPAPAPSSSKTARSVRGGAAPRTMHQLSSGSGRHLRYVADANRVANNGETTSDFKLPRDDIRRIRQRDLGHHFRSHQHNSSHRHPRHNLIGDDEDALFDQGYDQQDVMGEGDNYPEQHLGLLRVPCSIAINTEEAVSGHHQYFSHRCSPQAKTAMTAYVDTGAQVTVISASAARRAGIYHLIDRRYAGRATGVGHCKVLGRIPARHAHFILGESRTDSDECAINEECDGVLRMVGPALTVLEGTLAQGIDILLGLDVLQDWEAEIRMGPDKSITVKRRRGGGSVVIPFAGPVPQYPAGDNRGKARSGRLRSHSRTAHGNSPCCRSDFDKNDVNVDNGENFLPAAFSIDSDLDSLDRSGHKFSEDNGSIRMGKKIIQVTEDESMCAIGTVGMRVDYDGDEDDDYLKDVDEEDIMMDGEGELDMSGL